MQKFIERVEASTTVNTVTNNELSRLGSIYSNRTAPNKAQMRVLNTKSKCDQHAREQLSASTARFCSRRLERLLEIEAVLRCEAGARECRHLVLKCNITLLNVYWYNKTEKSKWIKRNNFPPESESTSSNVLKKTVSFVLVMGSSGASADQLQFATWLITYHFIQHKRWLRELNELVAQNCVRPDESVESTSVNLRSVLFVT